MPKNQQQVVDMARAQGIDPSKISNPSDVPQSTDGSELSAPSGNEFEIPSGSDPQKFTQKAKTVLSNYRAQFPGAYDAVPDSALYSAVIKKYPALHEKVKQASQGYQIAQIPQMAPDTTPFPEGGLAGMERSSKEGLKAFGNFGITLANVGLGGAQTLYQGLTGHAKEADAALKQTAQNALGMKMTTGYEGPDLAAPTAPLGDPGEDARQYRYAVEAGNRKGDGSWSDVAHDEMNKTSKGIDILHDLIVRHPEQLLMGADQLAAGRVGDLGFGGLSKTAAPSEMGKLAEGLGYAADKSAQLAKDAVSGTANKVRGAKDAVAKAAGEAVKNTAESLVGVTREDAHKVLHDATGEVKKAVEGGSENYASGEGGFLHQVKSGFEDVIGEKSAIGKEYESARAVTTDLSSQDVKDALAAKLKQRGIEMENGVVKKSGNLTDDEVNQVNKAIAEANYVVDNAKDGVISGQTLHDARKQMDKFIDFSSPSARDANAVLKDARRAIDDVAKENSPELKAVDAKFGPVTQQLEDLRDAFMTKDGRGGYELRPDWETRVKNAVNAGRGDRLDALEKVVPGIKNKIDAYRLAKRVETAFAVGKYEKGAKALGAGMGSAVGFAFGGPAGAAVGSLLGFAASAMATPRNYVAILTKAGAILRKLGVVSESAEDMAAAAGNISRKLKTGARMTKDESKDMLKLSAVAQRAKEMPTGSPETMPLAKGPETVKAHTSVEHFLASLKKPAEFALADAPKALAQEVAAGHMTAHEAAEAFKAVEEKALEASKTHGVDFLHRTALSARKAREEFQASLGATVDDLHGPRATSHVSGVFGEVNEAPKPVSHVGKIFGDQTELPVGKASKKGSTPVQSVDDGTLTPESTPDEVMAQAKARQDDIIAAYKEQHGNTINTDEVRPAFGGDRGVPASTTHEASSYISKKMLADAIAEAGARVKANGKSEPFNVLAGGGGSGKSAAGEEAAKFAKKKGVSDAVTWDGTTSEYARAKKMLDQAEGEGLTPVIWYSHRPVGDAWELGVVKRAVNQNAAKGVGNGRVVPFSAFKEAHEGARATALKLHDEGYDVRFIDNSGPKGTSKRVTRAEIEKSFAADDLAKLDHSKIADAVEKQLKAGKISERQAEVLLKGAEQPVAR